jgi:hypothetical protein
MSGAGAEHSKGLRALHDDGSVLVQAEANVGGTLSDCAKQSAESAALCECESTTSPRATRDQAPCAER